MERRRRDKNKADIPLCKPYGAGKDLDETFGLIETVEKTAQICVIAKSCGIINVISEAELKAVAKRFDITPKDGTLSK